MRAVARGMTASPRTVAGLCIALLMAPTLTRAAEWAETQGINHICSGVSQESRAEIASARGANARIMLTAGSNGQYLSDVQVTVSGGRLSHPASFQSGGPICLLKLPAGLYRIEAKYDGLRRIGELNVPSTQSSNPKSLKFNFPAD